MAGDGKGIATLSGRIATDVAACMGRRKKASAVSTEKEARRRAECQICLTCPLKVCVKEAAPRKYGCPLAKKMREEGKRDI